jgi:hypothetical protein
LLGRYYNTGDTEKFETYVALIPVEEYDGVLSLVELGQLHPLQDGVVDVKVALSICCLIKKRLLVFFCGLNNEKCPLVALKI